MLISGKKVDIQGMERVLPSVFFIKAGIQVSKADESDFMVV